MSLDKYFNNLIINKLFLVLLHSPNFFATNVAFEILVFGIKQNLIRNRVCMIDFFTFLNTSNENLLCHICGKEID